MARSEFKSPFSVGEVVTIDGDPSIRATVCGHFFREAYSSCEVSWFAQGVLQTQQVETWRLEPAEDRHGD